MRKLKTSKKISPNTLLRIYKKGFGYSKLTVIEANDYYIAALASKELVDHINNGDTVKVYLWVEDIASYEFQVKTIAKINSSPEILFFSHTDEIMHYEERKCLMTTSNIPIKFFILEKGEIDKGISLEKIVFHKGIVVNLSDREAIIQTSEKVHEKALIKGHIFIDDTEFELIAKIESIEKNNEYNYKISFTGMSDKNRNKLLEYIFNTYRE